MGIFIHIGMVVVGFIGLIFSIEVLFLGMNALVDVIVEHEESNKRNRRK